MVSKIEGDAGECKPAGQSVKRTCDSNSNSIASESKKLCADGVKDRVPNSVCFQNCTFLVENDFQCK